MKIYHGEAGSGKTTKIMENDFLETNTILVVANEQRRQEVIRSFELDSVDSMRVITAARMLHCRGEFHRSKNIVIDEAMDVLLAAMNCHRSIRAANITTEDLEETDYRGTR